MLDHVYVHLDGKIEALGRQGLTGPSDSARFETKSPFDPSRGGGSASRSRGSSARGRRPGSSDAAHAGTEMILAEDFVGDPTEIVSLAIIDARDNFEAQTEEAMAVMRKTKGALQRALQQPATRAEGSGRAATSGARPSSTDRAKPKSRRKKSLSKPRKQHQRRGESQSGQSTGLPDVHTPPPSR